MSYASRIDTVEGLMDEVAKAYAEGATQTEICEIAGVSDRGTVATWLKRSDVQVLVSKYIQDRSNRILRHTDTAIEKKLEADEGGMSLERLLKIRREFAGQSIKIDLKGEQAEAMEGLMRAFFENPELAAAFGGIELPEG